MRTRSNGRAAGRDAISLLIQDHRKVKRLLRELDKTTEKATTRRKTLFEEIENEITIHSKLEEEIFYPAYKEAGRKSDAHSYYEALEEHHLVDIVLLEMKISTAGSEKFGAKAKVLRDLIEHHAEEEETEMFPKARRAMSNEELRELGRQIQARKEDLQAGLLTRAARSAGSALGAIVSRVSGNGSTKRAA